MTQNPENTTADDILEFVDAIPASLAPCRRNHHEFAPQDVRPYTIRGVLITEQKDYGKAAALDVDEVCSNCGLVRHHTRSLRTRERSGFTYSHHNPLLRAPAGVFHTGVSVRGELQHRQWMEYLHAATQNSTAEPSKATKSSRGRKAA